MEKKRFFKILAKADAGAVAALAKSIRDRHQVTVIKAPAKTLAMIRMREPVRQSLFNIGEVMVCEALVELSGARGAAVTMGDDFEKTLNIAVLDAACNRGVFDGEDALLELEKAQIEQEEKENAMHLKTMVSFTSVDQEAPQ
jgi:alpha-D-ribose 1-methylphosphonate 5-triphosphate synthase subunit PhnG